MNFTILGPSDGQLQDNKSDTSDSNFGGNREYSQTAADKDYTSRTGNAPNKKENPVDETVRDIDDMANVESRKREFSRRDETSDTQKNNESVAIQSDSDRRPDEDTDPTKVPEASSLKQGRKANKWQFDSSDRYEGELS